MVAYGYTYAFAAGHGQNQRISPAIAFSETVDMFRLDPHLPSGRCMTPRLILKGYW